MKYIVNSYFVAALLIALLGMGCSASKTKKGAVIGGTTGGVLGGVVGKRSGDGTKGAIIGSVIGGSVGAVVGKYMDKQAREIEEEVPDATVETTTTTDPETGETVTESINVTFDSGILFGFDSYELTDNVKKEIDRMAEIFNRYPDTDILIEGHTDSKGTESYNLELSRQRAASVTDYLAADGVPRQRMTTRGYGETQPVSTNETDAGRADNRRVVLSIKGTENLRRKAENGELE